MRCTIDMQEQRAQPCWHGVCDVFRAMPITFHNAHRLFLASWLAAALFGLTAIVGSHPANAMETHTICASSIGPAELDRKIPKDLLTAIAQTESGRWDDRREAVFA